MELICPLEKGFNWSYGSLGSMVKQIFYYLTLGGLGNSLTFIEGVVDVGFKIEKA